MKCQMIIPGLGALVLSFLLVPSTASAQQLGTWAFQKHTDPLTDRVVHMAITVGDIDGNYSDRALIGVACTDGEIVVQASPVPYESRRKKRTVRWRTDRNPVVTALWDNGSENTAVMVWDEPAIEFARAVASAAERIVVNVEGVSVVYGVKGSTKSVRQTLSACGVS